METEETATGEAPNDKGVTGKDASVEELTPDKEATPDEGTTAGKRMRDP